MKTCGILMSISSLSSDYGIGTLGREAYKFVDFLKESNQTYWQILPLGPTSYGDSPYQTFSAFAGNPYFIDIDMLVEDGLLKYEDLIDYDFNFDESIVDYARIHNQRIDILKKAYVNFNIELDDYIDFKKGNKFWLDGYSKFMFLKYKHNGISWNKWCSKYKYYNEVELDDYEDVEFWCFVQYKFFEQWFKLKDYANSNGVKFIGDMAIYVAYDSADVWEYPINYMLDDNLEMIEVAGCPPDPFCEDGQLWGNPIYDWNYMKSTEYEFWVKRVELANQMYDITRIDHFRGFAGYYSIDADALNAKNGIWKSGPGFDLFKTIESKLGNIPIIAEDLGYITKDVTKLLEQTNFPGMKLITFGFSDMTNEHLPHNYDYNIVAYAGTHDNAPIEGWKKTLNEEELDFCLKYLNCSYENIRETIIERLYDSKAKYVIITMQDLLNLDESARMNTPSTVGSNWVWRMKKTALNKDLINYVKELTIKYNR